MEANLGRLPRLINAYMEVSAKLTERCLQFFGPWTVPNPEPELSPAPVYDREWYERVSQDSQNVTKRERAAIALKIPDSGLDWLDDMIKQSRQLDLEAAKQAAKGGDAS